MIETKVKRLKVQIRPLKDSVVSFLIPKTADLSEFYNLEDKLLDGYILSLKKAKKKSLNANSYMWVLCDKLAKVLKSTKEEIYRTIIKNVGLWFDITVDSKNMEEAIKCWENNGIGWVADKITDNVVRCYKGSSVYTQEELSRLINELISECKEQNIETLPEHELTRMLQSWGK